jgi:hypothetical protein
MFYFLIKVSICLISRGYFALTDITLSNKKIWIYGVGKIGRRLIYIFDFFKIEIKGFIVSDIKKNISSFRGINVYSLSDVVLGEDEIVIVAISGDNGEKVVAGLRKSGIGKAYLWDHSMLSELWKQADYKFIDRRKKSKKACIVLTGYKSFLWNDVFFRLKHFCPLDIDICLCTAGKYDETIEKIAEGNNWSYLSTDLNSVSLVQNIVISIFSEAEYFYKMDEDIFVTKGLFSNIFDTYEVAKYSSPFEIGVCAPLIPVNGACYRFILEKYNKLNEFEKCFGKAREGGNVQSEIEKNPACARFIWGEGGMPMLDKIAEDISGDSTFFPCQTRYSIGFILFQRSLWEDMNGFETLGNMDLGIDEEDLNSFCINNSRPIIISHNSIAGHFSFGRQTEDMKKYYETHRDRFSLFQNDK